MRKILLGTTALVAAGMFAGTAFAADPIKVTVGGYMEQWFGVVNDDAGTRNGDFNNATRNTQVFNSNSVDQQRDSEVWFTGKTKLDNGLEVGVTVELEGNSSADTIDESYATMEYAGWRFVVGSENGAAYLMHYAAPDVGIGFNSGDQLIWVQMGGLATAGYFDGAFGTTYLRVGDNDAQKIMLFTPRWFGFQAGLSYAPDLSEDNFFRNNTQALAAAGFGVISPIAGNVGRSAYSNAIGVGVNYVNKFDQLSLAASAGYVAANSPGASGIAGAQSNFTQFGADDISAYSFGLNLGWGNFLVGGSYASISDGFCLGLGAGTGVASCVASTSGSGYDIGARYTMGAWAISAIYFHGEQEGFLGAAGGAGAIAAQGAAGVAVNAAIANNQDEQDTYALSVAYTMGPGIWWRSSLFRTDFESELTGTAADLSNDGWGLVTGLRINF